MEEFCKFYQNSSTFCWPVHSDIDGTWQSLINMQVVSKCIIVYDPAAFLISKNSPAETRNLAAWKTEKTWKCQKRKLNIFLESQENFLWFKKLVVHIFFFTFMNGKMSIVERSYSYKKLSVSRSFTAILFFSSIFYKKNIFRHCQQKPYLGHQREKFP